VRANVHAACGVDRFLFGPNARPWKIPPNLMAIFENLSQNPIAVFSRKDKRTIRNYGTRLADLKEPRRNMTQEIRDNCFALRQVRVEDDG
jgi:hypothetical protein